MKRILYAGLVASTIFYAGNAMAEEKASGVDELEKRIEALEKKAKETEVVDELGHKLHPTHSVYGLKISGGLTLTAQGTSHIKGADTRGEAAISADLTIESPVGENGRAVIVFDFQRGSGLSSPPLPSFILGPNGNPTGPNADIESFNSDQLNVTQIYYEHNITPSLMVSLGKLDPTGYFDANEYANNERSQFMANSFVNNPTIEFGGSADFYGPGVRLTYAPVENFDLSIGAFEGDGDFNDVFDSPFLIAEANFKLKPHGRDGNYRLYYWSRHGRTGVANTANPNDTTLLKEENNGAGVSIDQAISEKAGVWLRAGVQRDKVAQFDKSVSVGFQITGLCDKRENDVMGFGYGTTWLGKDYKDYLHSLSANYDYGSERYMELYYNYAVGNATSVRGVHVTPDIQYVINPGGNRDANNLLIYGVRLQAFF